MKKNFTCIVCPVGCSITVTMEEGNIVSIEGNTCARGKEYAQNECTAPKRVVTSTMRLENGKLIPVKTDKVIPKENMFDCMKKINSNTASLPVHAGDVLIGDVFGANIIACADAEE